MSRLQWSWIPCLYGKVSHSGGKSLLAGQVRAQHLATRHLADLHR